jgi:hypothetical protein
MNLTPLLPSTPLTFDLAVFRLAEDSDDSPTSLNFAPGSS